MTRNTTRLARQPGVAGSRMRKALMLKAAIVAALAASAALAEKRYAPGVSDSEIKIGQTMPYSGPASAYGTIGKAELAYFTMINERGGINGRKINLISLDDAYSPPKTVEQTRKLVEQEGVAFIFGSLGTATNTAVSVPRPTLRFRNISTTARCRSFCSARPPASSTIRSAIPGPRRWRRPAITPKARSTASTSRSIRPPPGSPSSFRTTISAKTMSGYPLHRGAPSLDARASTRSSRDSSSGEGAPQPFFRQL